MSPCHFAIYIDDIVIKFKTLGRNFNYEYVCTNIFLYADDIVFLSPSLSILQNMMYLCESEQSALDMCMHVKKSTCMHFGPGFDRKCANLITMSGHMLEWVSVCRHLGVFFVSARTRKFSLDNCKVKCYGSFNAVFGRRGRNASCELIVHLLLLICLPILLYGLETCTINNSDIRTLQHLVNNVI